MKKLTQILSFLPKTNTVIEYILWQEMFIKGLFLIFQISILLSLQNSITNCWVFTDDTHITSILSGLILIMIDLICEEGSPRIFNVPTLFVPHLLAVATRYFEKFKACINIRIVRSFSNLILINTSDNLLLSLRILVTEYFLIKCTQRRSVCLRVIHSGPISK
jgi:hypothetical protein